VVQWRGVHARLRLDGASAVVVMCSGGAVLYKARLCLDGASAVVVMCSGGAVVYKARLRLDRAFDLFEGGA
jgi:hypothetical protein